jgi:DNA-directed RNA polymerase specialized sigma24 family protein
MSPQAGWILQEEIVPRLRSAIPRNVNQIGSEDAEELIQDSIVMAAKMLDRTERQGKTVTPGNIAYYTILHMKSGRRSTGSSNSDVLGTATQLNGRSTTTSFDEPVHEESELGEEFTVNDVLSLDDEDPGQKACRKIDWEELLGSLTKRQQLLVESMLAGKNRVQAARLIGVSSWTVRQDRMELAQKILEFMGADILVEILRIPGWRNNLNAERELLACKYDRRH